MTAVGTADLIGAVANAGALGFVVKPARPDALKKVAGDALA